MQDADLIEGLLDRTREKHAFWAPLRGAVSLTFDDGRRSQLEVALPLLDRYDLKGTFYLCPRGDDWEGELAPWQAVAGSGHEIGNHSLSHPASTNFTGVPSGGYEDATLDQIESDILAAQARLECIAPHQRAWTFCYPCYITDVGRGISRRSYVPFVAEHFVAGRARGEFGFGNYPATVDLACLWAQPADGMNGFELIGLAEELTARGQWVVFVFHEVGGGRLSVDTHDFWAFLSFLDRRRDTIRAGTVVEIARDIAQLQAELQATEESG